DSAESEIYSKVDIETRELIIPREVLDIVQSNLQRTKLLGKKESPLFIGLISTTGSFGYYIFKAISDQKERPLIIAHTTRGTTLQSGYNQQPWRFILDYCFSSEDVVNCTPQDILNAYKTEQIKKLSENLGVSSELQEVEENLDSESI